MYDIHCHLIPGVDDGADNIGESLEMCMRAVEGGTKGIVLTPHSNVPKHYKNYWNRELHDKVSRLREEIEARNIALKLFVGQEIYLTGDVAGMLKAGELITINGSRYPLVELNMNEESETAYMKLKKLRSEGYVPVLAHPERYAFFAHHENAEERIKNMGCLLQINKGSLRGYYGRTAQSVVRRILDGRMADVVASDAHGPFERTPYMENAYEVVAGSTSMEYADYLFSETPKRIIADKEVASYR